MKQSRRRKKVPELRTDSTKKNLVVARKSSRDSYSKRGESTFKRLMGVVATMYRERGYERTSISALARRAGLTAPAIYHYFGSKEEILVEFLQYTIDDLIKTMKSGNRGKTATQRLRNLMKTLVRWQLQHAPFPEAYGRIVGLGHLRDSLSDHHRSRILAKEREFYEIIRDVISEGIETGDFRNVPAPPVAFAIIAIGDYILSWYNPEGPLTQNQLAKSYSDLVVAMVKK